jgi:hypothetical protein
MAVFASSHARADCREDTREVRFDNTEGEQGQNGAIMWLKRCNCDLTVRQQGSKIQVEFRRFSNVSASMIVLGSPTDAIRQPIGESALVMNNVFTQ